MLVPMKVDYGVRILVHLASLEPDTIVKATEISKKDIYQKNSFFKYQMN